MNRTESAVTRTVTESVYITQSSSSHTADYSVLTFPPSVQYLAGSNEAISNSIGSTFVYGLLAGQLSVLLVMCFFIRFFIFADPPPDKKDYQSHVRQQRQAKLLLPEVNASPSDILERTYYDVNTHAPESLDWLTVLIAQGVRHFRRARWDNPDPSVSTATSSGGEQDGANNAEDSDSETPAGSDKLEVLERLLNFDKLPGFVDKIKVVELNIGKNFPVFRNCKIVKRKSQSVAAAAAEAAAAAIASNLNGLADEEAIAGSDYSDNEIESLLSTPRQSLRRRRSSHYRRPSRSTATRTRSSSSVSSPSTPDILEVQMDVELKDTITLGIETQLILNFPRPGFAFLPVKLVVTVVQFSGTLKISLRNNKNSVPEPTAEGLSEAMNKNNTENSNSNDANLTGNNPSDSEAVFDDDESGGDYAARPSTTDSGGHSGVDHDGEAHHADDGAAGASAKKSNSRNRLYDDAYVTLSFEPNYTLRFDIQSSIGRAATSRLMNVDKIAQLVEYRLKSVFEERFVYPNQRKFYLPSVLPKKEPGSAEGNSGGGKPNPQQTAGSQQQSQQPQQSQQSDMGSHGFIIDDHLSSPRLHPRSFSSVSQLASNTALNMPVMTPLPLRNQQLAQDDDSAII